MARKEENQNQAQSQEHNDRRALLDQAHSQLANGESLFDIAQYPLLKLAAVPSAIQSLSEIGITTKLLDGESDNGAVPSAEQVQKAREVIFNDGDPAKGYRFVARREVPVVKDEAYASIETLATALQQWLTAVAAFDQAHVWVGTKGFGRKTHYVDGGQMGKDQPTSPAVLLKNHLEKGIKLVLQGAAYSDVKPSAVEFAKSVGFSAPTKTARVRSTRVMEEA